MTQGQFFKRGLTGLNSEFSFSLTSCLTKAEEPYYLPIAGGRIIGFIPFPRALVLCEMQSVSSRIGTRVAVSISYDDNHYTTGTSLNHWHIKYIWLIFVLWHINDCRLFDVKSSLSLSLALSLYIYILSIYDLIWLGFMAYHSLYVI